MESRHVVFRFAGLQLAHADRLNYRSRYCKSIDGSTNRHERRGLGAGREHRQVASNFADGWLPLRGTAADSDEGTGEGEEALRSSRRNETATLLDPRATDVDVHRREFFPRFK